MRGITKAAEPRELREHHNSPSSTYANLTAEALKAIRQSLAREQHYLCCYCMATIDPRAGIDGKVTRMRIEHWWPQSDPEGGEERALDYKNMLGACPGNEGNPPALQHCDVRKGQQRIRLDPRAPSAHPRQLKYTTSGAIEASSAELQADIDRKLNLNAAHLKANRREALARFQQGLIEKLGSDRQWSSERLQREIERLQQPDPDGRLLPYLEVLLYWMRRRAG